MQAARPWDSVTKCVGKYIDSPVIAWVTELQIWFLGSRLVQGNYYWMGEAIKFYHDS